MYDLEVSSLSNHEKKVLNALAEFVNTQIPQASLSAIDDIVLSYVVGVLEDITSDDEFDVDTFVEMIAAYVPGFEAIELAVVCEWMFTLSSKLLKKDEENLCDEVSVPDREPEVPSVTETVSEKNCHEESPVTKNSSDDTSVMDHCPTERLNRSTSNNNNDDHDGDGADDNNNDEDDDDASKEDPLSIKAEDLTVWEQNITTSLEEVSTCSMEYQCLQILEVVPSASFEEVRESLSQSGGDLEQAVEVLMDRMALQETGQTEKKGDFLASPESQVAFITKLQKSEQKRKKYRRKSTKEKDVTVLEGEIQTSSVSKSVVMPNQISNMDVNRDGIQHLLELFPAASSMDAQQCLAIAKGDVEGAAQLLLERINSGEIQPRSTYPKFQKARAVDERKQRELLLQKYAFVDTEDDKKDHHPFLPKPYSADGKQ